MRYAGEFLKESLGSKPGVRMLFYAFIIVSYELILSHRKIDQSLQPFDIVGCRNKLWDTRPGHNWVPSSIAMGERQRHQITWLPCSCDRRHEFLVLSHETFIESQTKEQFVRLASLNIHVEIGNWETNFELGGQRVLHLFFTALRLVKLDKSAI